MITAATQVPRSRPPITIRIRRSAPYAVPVSSPVTTASVAAHTLYEKTHPFLLAGPGGTLDLSNCKYEQVTDRRVRVSGSKSFA